MKRIGFLALATLAALLLAGIRPSAVRAASNDLTQPLIIGGAIAGGAAAIALIAILVAGDEEPEGFPLAPGHERARRGSAGGTVRFGTRCRSENGNLPLLCW